MPLPRIKKFRYEFVITAAIIILLSFVLMRRPIMGVADNGDFARIMNSTGLHYFSSEHYDRYFGYVNREYVIGHMVPFGGGYVSTQLALVVSAVVLSKTFRDSGVFDIRYLGVIYVLFLATAAFFAVKSCRKSFGAAGIIIAISIIIIFCDTGYVSYFNSLYGEPVTFVFLLLMAAMALTISSEERPAIWMLLIFGIAAILFAGAKVQNIPAGILSSLLFLRLAAMRRDKVWRRSAFGLAAGVILVSIICYCNVSSDIRICNKYQTVFYGILKDSEDPAGDLEELGLDQSLDVLAGTNYFMEDYAVDIRSSDFKRMINENVDHFKIASYYLKHPHRFVEKMEIAAENGFKLNQGMGNYEKSPGIAYKQVSEVFNRWSSFKLGALPHSLLFISIFYGAALLVLLFEYSRASCAKMRFLTEFFGFVLLAGMIQFILPIIGDGEADLSKHLFLFNLCFDMLFSASLAYIAVKAGALIRLPSRKGFFARLRPE